MTASSAVGAGQETLATVVVCTRDRAESLARMLESLVVSADRAEAFRAPWDVLIVDNGSSDHTAEVVARFAGRLPIRRLHHPVPGLSNARNAGIDAARGRFILWTDDDVLIDPDWLVGYLRAFTAFPDTDLFGGRAVPRYEAPVAAWMPANEHSLGSLLAIRDTPEWTTITPDRLPYGLNYAVRREVQRRHRYDPDLGVAPGRRTGGEETAMLQAALSDGATGRWVWDATVHHLIPVHRQSAAYVFEYYAAQGALYPKCRPAAPTALARAKAYLTALDQACRNAAFATLRYRTGRIHWVGAYADYARWAGTLRWLRTAARHDR